MVRFFLSHMATLSSPFPSSSHQSRYLCQSLHHKMRQRVIQSQRLIVFLIHSKWHNSRSKLERTRASATYTKSKLEKWSDDVVKWQDGTDTNNDYLYRSVNHIAETPAALGGVSQVTAKAEKYLLTCLSKLELRDAFAVPNLGGFLLCGPHGAGKTVVARSLIRKLAQNRETLACRFSFNPVFLYLSHFPNDQRFPL